MCNSAIEPKLWHSVINKFFDADKELSSTKSIGRIKDKILKILLLKALSKLTAETERDLEKGMERKFQKFLLGDDLNPKKDLFPLYESLKATGSCINLDEQIQKNSQNNDFKNIFINYVISLQDEIGPATHVPKLSHSSSTASFIIDSIEKSKNVFLSTSYLKNKTMDGAYSNADLSKQVKFLLSDIEGVYLYEALLIDGKKILKPFSSDEKEVTQWNDAFIKTWNSPLKSNALVKQSYFPVDGDYHLLQILKSSTLLQALHLTYFEKEARKPYEKSKNQRQKSKYSDVLHVRFPNLAKLKTVQSQPQNVSVLNGGRSGGRISLFSTQPPTWKSEISAPQGTSLFHGEFSYYSQTKTCVDIIAAYLTGYELAQLSQRHPDKYLKVAKVVHQLVDSVCNYATRLHTLESGWTKESKLKSTHQHWLDPYRECPEFQAARETGHYKEEIVQDFSKWLNQQINKYHKGLNLGAEQQRIWTKMSAENFRLFNQLID